MRCWACEQILSLAPAQPPDARVAPGKLACCVDQEARQAIVITVHHLNNSRSQRILWLLEELGVEYTIVHHQRDPKTMLAPASLKAVHPLGKSPVIVDGRHTLAESGAIIEYLADTSGKELGLAPEPGTSERLRYNYWMHYAEGSAMPPLLMSLIFSKIRTAPMPFFIRPIAKAIADKAMAGYVGPQVKLHLDYMNEVQRRRHPDEFSDRSRIRARRHGQVPASGGLPEEDPRTSGVSACLGKGRSVRVDALKRQSGSFCGSDLVSPAATAGARATRSLPQQARACRHLAEHQEISRSSA